MYSLLGLNGLQQLFEGEFGRLAQVDNLALFRADFGCHFGDTRGNIERNRDDSVDIRVQQVSGSNRNPNDLDRGSEIDNVHVCVGNGHSRSEHRKPILLTPGISRTDPLVTIPSHCRALRTAACTSPMVEAPLIGASRSWKMAMRGTGSSPMVSHQSVRSA